MSDGLRFDKHPSDFGDDVAEIEKFGCDNVLYRIQPPRQWEMDDVTYYQKISNQPATNLDVKKLGDKLDAYLKQSKAKEVGICPIKRKLYGQCLDEVIRQETLNCAERGFMLIKIRDEMNMTINSYQELYESIIAYGIRKMLLDEHNTEALDKCVEKLKIENLRLKTELATTIAATEQLESGAVEARDEENRQHAEELNTLKKTIHTLKDKLESIINEDDDDPLS